MIYIVTQDQTEGYDIYYYHIKEDETYHFYSIVGLARLNLTKTKLVTLGLYSTYKQATEVFADIDYNDNDLMYYKTNKKIFYMPVNIVNGQECPIKPIDYNFDTIVNVKNNQYKFIIGDESYIENNGLHIRSNTYVKGSGIYIPTGGNYE